MLRNLFEFGVTRPFPYGRLWNLLTLIFATAVLAFLFVYATATAGYDTVTKSSNNYNLKQTGWHTVFSGKKTGICAERLISVGDKVYTSTSGVMGWTVMNWRDRTTGEFIWGVDYAAEVIESCYLVELVMEPSLNPEVTANYLTMNCTLGNYDLKLGANLVLPANVDMARTQFAATGFTEQKQTLVAWNALFDLTMAWDGIWGLRAAALTSAQNYQMSFGITSNLTDFCGHDVKSDDLSRCRRSFTPGAQTYTRWSSLSSDASDRYLQPIPSQLTAPFANFAVWITQVAYWDLGLASSTNLIRNYADRSKYLQKCANCPLANDFLDRQPYQIFYEGIILKADDPGFTPPTKQSLNVQYLCQVKKLKSPGNLVQAILVAALGLFATFWAIYKTFWTMWGSHFGSEAHKRIFSGEPGTPLASAGTLPYQPVKASSTPGLFDPANQQMGYVPQQGYSTQQQGYAPQPQHAYDPHQGWKQSV